VRVVEVTRPALVLGSTQTAVDPPGIEVVRRRSGGGAVLVGPGELVWADVLVPAGDPLWEGDVGVAFHWLGEVWVQALASLGVAADWHRGPMVSTAWCRQVCFAGIGPGEVVAADHKVVGIAQRRTRAGSLFQCAALLRWDPQVMVRLLGLGVDATADLARMAAPVNAAASDIEDAFVVAIGAEASGSA
jgi:lipoate-protein ligase A